MRVYKGYGDNWPPTSFYEFALFKSQIATVSLCFVRNILTFAKIFDMARTMTVALGPHYEEFIQSTIVSGRYNNASEVVRAALRHLEDEEAKLAALRAAIDEGDASGDVVGFDRDVFLSELRD